MRGEGGAGAEGQRACNCVNSDPAGGSRWSSGKPEGFGRGREGVKDDGYKEGGDRGGVGGGGSNGCVSGETGCVNRLKNAGTGALQGC